MESANRLESWKEIAVYLKRDVRTVQRWEAAEGLPVHRHQHTKRGSVSAYPTELDAWRDSRRPEMFAIPESAPPPDAPSLTERRAAGERQPFVLSWSAAGAVLSVAIAAIAAMLWARFPRAAPIIAAPATIVDAPRLFGEAFREGGTLRRFAIGGNGGDLVLAPDGATLFVSLCGPDGAGIQAVDTRNGTISWTLGGLQGCAPLIASARADRLFLPDSTDIAIVDTATRAVRRIRTPSARLSDLAIAPDDRTLYVAAVFSGLLVVDTETGGVRTMSRLPCPVHLALAQLASRLYVNYQCSGPGGSRGHDAMEVFDTGTGKSVGIIRGLPNVGGDMAVTPDGSHVWADGRDACKSAYYDKAGCPPGPGAIVNVIRTSDDTPVRSLRVGAADEFGIRLSFTRDGSRVVAGRTQTMVVNTATLTEMERSPLALDGNVVFAPDGRTAYAILGDRKSIAVLPIADHPVPPPGLTARWTFDGIGTDAAGGNHLGPFVPEAFAPGRVGMSLRMEDGPQVRIQSPPNLDIDRGHLTAMAWVKFSPAIGERDLGQTVMEYVARGPTGLFGWALARSPDGRAAVCLGWFGGKGCDPERSSLVQGTSSLAAGQWHHLAITRAADTFALYVNGRADGTGRVRGGFSELIDMWVRLGSDEAGAAALRGLIDEIEIYNRALTPEEIQSRGK